MLYTGYDILLEKRSNFSWTVWTGLDLKSTRYAIPSARVYESVQSDETNNHFIKRNNYFMKHLYKNVTMNTVRVLSVS